LGRPHGLDGFLGIYVDEDDVVSLDAGSLVYLGDHAYSVRELRRTDRGFQIAFAEVADRETAEDLRGRDVP
jgi:ribosomal 30S subunit maturation factor RimM